MEQHSVIDDYDRRLLAAREAFPEWDIYRVFAGYVAVPKDAAFIQSIDIDGLVAKIRRMVVAEAE